MNLTPQEKHFENRAMEGLESAAGPVTARAIAEASGSPESSVPGIAHALDRLAARGRISAKPLRPGLRTGPGNPVRYVLRPGSDPNGNRAPAPPAANGFNLVAAGMKPAAAAVPPAPAASAPAAPADTKPVNASPPPAPAPKRGRFRGSLPGRTRKHDHDAAIRRVLDDTPRSLGELSRLAFGYPCSSPGFRLAIEKMVTAGEAVCLPRQHPARPPRTGNTDRYRLAAAAPAASPKPGAGETSPRNALQQAADAALADWKAAVAMAAEAEAAAREAVWQLARHEADDR